MEKGPDSLAGRDKSIMAAGRFAGEQLRGFLFRACLIGSGESHSGRLTLTWVAGSVDELGFAIDRSAGTTGVRGHCTW